MASDALKIAKLQARQHQTDALLKVLTNPIVELVAVVLLCNEVEKSGSWIEGQLKSAAIWPVGTGLIAIQQLSPLVPSLVAGGTDILKALPAIVPLLAAGV
jgi:hypothetical protein